VSIIDRFLEQARILYFHHGGDERVFISSADWMPRNLDRRVELLVPILDDTCKRRAIQILRTCMRDTRKARLLTPDGLYLQPAGPEPEPGTPATTGGRRRRKTPAPTPTDPAARGVHSQAEFQRRAKEAAETAFERNRTTFTPIEPMH
jgi:polyphosphate kinase